MISGAITVLRPTAPGVAPGTALPAGPQGPMGLSGPQGPMGPIGPTGATGQIGATGPAATQAAVATAVQTILAEPALLGQALSTLAATLPTSDPNFLFAPWLNGGALTFSTGP